MNIMDVGGGYVLKLMYVRVNLQKLVGFNWCCRFMVHVFLYLFISQHSLFIPTISSLLSLSFLQTLWVVEEDRFMAADVSCLVRLMNGGDGTDPVKPTAPITRDLLAGCVTVDSEELDLDLHVPCGWEKRLDLKSGKVYLQRCNASCSTTENNAAANRRTLSLFDDDGLDLRLDSPSSPYRSVCTLDKVKSALERAEKETEMRKKRSSTSTSMSMSSSSSSIKDSGADEEERSCSALAAGCPGCLLYVLISKSHPRCPRCNSSVPLPSSSPPKKPRIDLNISTFL